MAANPLAWWFGLLQVSLVVVVSGFVRPAGVVRCPAWIGIFVYLLAWRSLRFRPPALVSTSLIFVRRRIVLL